MVHVRELPPLRLHIDAIAPSGRHYRWGDDEPNPSNVPSGLRFSSTMPGGFENFDVTLPRKSGIDYSDLDRFSTLRALGAGGDVAGEYRLERAPRVSGDRMAVTPGAVGWQAHLEDDKSASMIYIDRDMGRWQNMSGIRQANLLGAGWAVGGWDVRTNESGPPTLVQQIDGAWVAGRLPISETIYDAGPGNRLGRLVADYQTGPLINNADAAWTVQAFLSADISTFTVHNVSSGDVAAVAVGTVDISRSGENDLRYTLLQFSYGVSPAGSDGSQYTINWSDIAVIGDHALAISADADGKYGVLSSNVVQHAVSRWAPLLTVTDDSIQTSSFVVPQAAFYDPTTAAEIVRQATRFGLQDWAVWENKTFYWHDRGARGRSWRARISPARLEETGPQVDRLWESVIVQYQDVDGSTRTVGPPGSGADTESSSLKDTDPENPANRLGIVRRDLLVMGVGTPASATEVGRRFLQEQKILDSSGRAELVGYVEDDRGVRHPYWRVRAGDTITFVDAADPSARRIVRAEHDHDRRTCSIDLDAPPEGLAALLERLGVVLVPLGVG